jgi:release factor glutamine methyltransferase
VAGWLAAAGYGLMRPAMRRRLRRTVLERVDGVPLVVLPEVLNPRVFRTGAWLARAIPPAPGAGCRALDMGTGSGIGAVFAARRGYRVTAVDINPHAVRCARANALLNGVEAQVEVREGDLFAPVAGERFDLVLFNPPFFPGPPRDPLDAAWRSQDVIERFSAGLPGALAPGGRALLLLSSAGDADRKLAAHAPAELDLATVSRRDFANETITVFAATWRTADGARRAESSGGGGHERLVLGGAVR